ncbi:MAG: hypothetical protein J4N26_01470, partial [Chloroflexi bacterium]|nr:hypothetical protein [Chloroflexota bacterium]
MSERTAEEIKGAVLDRYGTRAREQLAKGADTIELASAEGSACGDPDCCGGTEAAPADTSTETSSWADKLYSAEQLGQVPQEVTELSLGCG